MLGTEDENGTQSEAQQHGSYGYGQRGREKRRLQKPCHVRKADKSSFA